MGCCCFTCDSVMKRINTIWICDNQCSSGCKQMRISAQEWSQMSDKFPQFDPMIDNKESLFLLQDGKINLVLENGQVIARKDKIYQGMQIFIRQCFNNGTSYVLIHEPALTPFQCRKIYFIICSMLINEDKYFQSKRNRFCFYPFLRVYLPWKRIDYYEKKYLIRKAIKQITFLASQSIVNPLLNDSYE